jgi:acetate kinase
LAVDVFCHRCAAALASLMIDLGGLDALVFTGGIGERAAGVRAAIVGLARPLGLRLEPDANARHAQRISRAADLPSIWVLPADEDGALARHAARWLQAPETTG